MLDSAGVALHGVQRGSVTTGDAVLVTGPGAVGQFSFQYSRAAGAARHHDRPRPAAAFAAKMGAVAVDYEKVDDPVAKVMEITGGVGVDCAVESPARSRPSTGPSPVRARRAAWSWPACRPTRSPSRGAP